jgi:hypothetical protein
MHCALLAAALVVSNTAGAETSDAVAPFSRGTEGGALPPGWEVQRLGRIAPTRYALVRDGNAIVVRAEAEASASGLAFRFAAPSPEGLVLRWRWKGERLPDGADATRRETDDAVARVYVTFRRSRDRMTAEDRSLDATASMFGEAPPHATLLYAWDARAPVGGSFPSPYTDRVRVVVVESGHARLGQWLAYERDIAADYRAAFGSELPMMTGVAIMTDADNTRSRATAYYGDIVVGMRGDAVKPAAPPRTPASPRAAPSRPQRSSPP